MQDNVITLWMCASANDIAMGVERVKMLQPAHKCEQMQMRAVFVNGPIPGQKPKNAQSCDVLATRKNV